MIGKQKQQQIIQAVENGVADRIISELLSDPKVVELKNELVALLRPDVIELMHTEVEKYRKENV